MSSSGFGNRFINDIGHDQAQNSNRTANGLSLNRQRSERQAAQLENRFQHLQVNSDINIGSMQTTSSSNVSSHASCLPTEALAEEELIERLKALINEFMTRSNRHYSYNTTMRWTIDHGQQIKYTVVIVVKQASDSI